MRLSFLFSPLLYMFCHHHHHFHHPFIYTSLNNRQSPLLSPPSRFFLHLFSSFISSLFRVKFSSRFFTRLPFASGLLVLFYFVFLYNDLFTVFTYFSFVCFCLPFIDLLFYLYFIYLIFLYLHFIKHSETPLKHLFFYPPGHCFCLPSH